jgi:ABC-type cobalamin/Fe3+-siderophores transport system ATPase subunit
MAGRPTKLTPQTQARIVQAIVGGNDITVAAAYAGIGKTTFYEWLERGRKAKTGPFAAFADAIQKAQADAETRNVALIAKAAQDGTWTAAAWWLERKHPERWGRKERHEVTGKDGKDLVIRVVYADVDIDTTAPTFSAENSHP